MDGRVRNDRHETDCKVVANFYWSCHIGDWCSSVDCKVYMKKKKMLIPNGGNDIIMTPKSVAEKVVRWANPSGLVLEPCSGTGVFLKAIMDYNCDAVECEITKGRDFYDFKDNVDWIITNPPWSQARKFMLHSMELSDNIVFLITVNHIIALKARIRDLTSHGFWMTKCLLLETPKEFPQSGFQLCACLVQKTTSRITEFNF